MSVQKIHVPSVCCNIELTHGMSLVNTSMFKETRAFDWPEELVTDTLNAILRSEKVTPEIRNDVEDALFDHETKAEMPSGHVQFIVDDLLVTVYSRDGYWRIGGHWPYELQRSNDMCMSFTRFIISLANVQRGYNRQETYDVRYI